MKERNRQEGITLVALVITVIVLIILAGVTLSTLVGDSGIITKAQEAKQNMTNAVGDEEELLQNLLNEIKEIETEGEGIEGPTDPTITVSLNIRAEIQNLKELYRVGEKSRYLITVVNESNVDLNNVEISCILEGTDGIPKYVNEDGTVTEKNTISADFKKGESKSFEYIYDITRKDAEGCIYLKATASVKDPKDSSKVIIEEDINGEALVIEELYTLTINYIYEKSRNSSPKYCTTILRRRNLRIYFA